jgi:hypothetical protein
MEELNGIKWSDFSTALRIVRDSKILPESNPLKFLIYHLGPLYSQFAEKNDKTVSRYSLQIDCGLQGMKNNWPEIIFKFFRCEGKDFDSHPWVLQPADPAPI